jgi:nicotinate-nucleotide pyrophosphorylase
MIIQYAFSCFYADANGFSYREGVLAGVPFFTRIFEYLHCTVEWHHQEGECISPHLLVVSSSEGISVV